MKKKVLGFVMGTIMVAMSAAQLNTFTNDTVSNLPTDEAIVLETEQDNSTDSNENEGESSLDLFVSENITIIPGKDGLEIVDKVTGEIKGEIPDFDHISSSIQQNIVSVGAVINGTFNKPEKPESSVNTEKPNKEPDKDTVVVPDKEEKPEIKPEIKPEDKPEVKPETKPDDEEEVIKPETKPSEEPTEKPPVPENKPVTPPSTETPNKPVEKPSEIPSTPIVRPSFPVIKPNDKPSIKPEVTPETKPEVKPEQKPEVNESNFIATVEQEIFQIVNKERAANGLPALSYNNTMQKYARIKSKDMGDNNYFSHEDLNGNLITVQMKADGVSYRAWGENIAWMTNRSGLAQQFMTNWMNSSGHRANILSNNFSSIGIGVYKIGNKIYATQEFYR